MVQRRSRGNSRVRPNTASLVHIHRQLRRFRTESDVQHLAQRLFQKDPNILEEFTSLVNSTPYGRRLPEARHFIVSTIDGAVNNAKASQVLPTNVENYVSFCDLTWTLRHSDRHQWHTFQLTDFPGPLIHELDGSVPLLKLRKLVKKKLADDKQTLASVQMDIKGLEDVDMVLLRIVSCKKTKDGTRDEKKMLVKKATFIVYFAGEPYFYANSQSPDLEHCEIFANCLECSAYKALPLHGKHVESLRQMRLTKDHGDMESLWQQEDKPLPMLNMLQLACTYTFKGDEAMANSQQVTQEGFEVNVDLKGKDVLNALRSLNKNVNLLSNPLPRWTKKSSNVITVNRRPAADNDDQMSVAASNMTYC